MEHLLTYNLSAFGPILTEAGPSSSLQARRMCAAVPDYSSDIDLCYRLTANQFFALWIVHQQYITSLVERPADSLNQLARLAKQEIHTRDPCALAFQI